MPRKGLVFRRTQATDPVYASDIVEKFICSMMWEGKKSTAQRVFYGAMDQVAKKTNDDALKIFKKAIENVKPIIRPNNVKVAPRISLKSSNILSSGLLCRAWEIEPMRAPTQKTPMETTDTKRG